MESFITLSTEKTKLYCF